MSMKDSFEHFFMLRSQFFEKYKDVDLPRPMTPIEQDKTFDFEKVEKDIGFTIHCDIKAFLSTYWFDMIEGFFIDRYVNINGVQKTEDVVNDLITGFAMGDELFLSDARSWYLGGCDPYSMYVNNTTGKLIAVIPYENKAMCLSDSISDLISHMKCELD